MHTRTRDSFIAVHQVLALAEAIQEHCHRADIETVRTQPHQVVQDAGDLVEHDADVLGPFRHLHAKQLFDRHHIGMFVTHHRHVVETVHVADALVERFRFRKLLGCAMQQADMRVRFLNGLAFNLEHQTQYAMRRRMLRAEVHRIALNLSHR